MANLLTDLTLTSAHVVGGSFADITDMSSTVSIVGTNSVVLLMMAVMAEIDGSDDIADYRFTVDGARAGPEVASMMDTADGGTGRGLMFAVTGLSPGNHTFAVQARNRSGVTTIDTTRPRSFQVVEIETGAQILIDLETQAVDVAQASFTNMVNLSAAATPADGALLLFTHGSQIESVGDDEVGEHRFAIDGTDEGPMAPHSEDAVDELTGVCMAYGRTGVSAASHTFSIQWRDSDGGPAMDTAVPRTFQVIEISANADLLVDLESLSSDAAPATFADMDNMSGNPSIDSTDSVVLILPNWSPDPASNESADTRLVVAAVQEGAQLTVWTDDLPETRADHGFTPLALTGESGATAMSLQWEDRLGSPETSTTRQRTFQIIDLVSPAGNMAGSADLTLTPAATIQANGELAGSAALVITPTATIAGLGELAGAIALLLTPAGTLQARGELLGTAALVITPAGTLSTLGNLAGEIPLVLTATGTLTALGALAGAATIVITPSGTIQATGGLLGTTTLTLTLAGDLQALGELLGSTDLVITPTGTLNAEGFISGSADMVLTPAGTLQAVGELTGAVPLSLTAAGAIIARGALSGGLTMTLTPSGTIRADASIAGGVSLVFTLAGQLLQIGALAGSVDMVITPAGDILGVGELAGSADLAITAAGNLGGKAGLVGSAQLTITADGTLRAIGELQGLATLAFTLAGTIFDQSARRIPNSVQTFLAFLQNSRQDLSAGQLNSDQSLTSGRTNSEQ